MIRAFQWDLARQVERLDVLRGLLPKYAAWGYHELYLHLEDAVHYPSVPGIGRSDAYQYEELGELVLEAARHGLRTVPIVNLLGHTQYLIKHPELRDLNELRDDRGRPLETGQICPLHPRFLELATRLLRDLAPYCTGGKVHVGLDESFHLGRCPRCRAEVERIGLAGHFAGHVKRLHAVTESLGLTLGMWADMLYFVPEAIGQLPRGIIAYDWYYYPFARLPRVEFFNFAERDLAAPLHARGIAYYGCPMNGAFRYEPMPVFGERLANIRSWWRRCREVQADGLLVTSWEAYRLAFETTVAVDAAAATLWLEDGGDDDVMMLAQGLGRSFDLGPTKELARSLLRADEFAFTGYARWQINERWDTFAGTEGLAVYERELRFFRRLARRAASGRWPLALAASLAFRLYLAERDVFVRRAARGVFLLRRARVRTLPWRRELIRLQSEADRFVTALTAGRKAARAMWVRTRDPAAAGQNERILGLDETRLAEWKQWLARATKVPDLVRTAAPVCGAWQLQFWVHNFAPAVQKILVEQQAPDGSWHELGARFTIEFRAAAARPASKLKREFTVPVPDPAGALRIAIRGIGQVAVSHVQLTDGVTRRQTGAFRKRKILGRPAPTRGFPEIEWQRNVEELPLRWRR